MSSILERLNKAKKSSAPDDREYQSYMADFIQKAKDDAKRDAAADIDRARAETERVMAERDSARLMQQVSESLVSELRTDVEKLKSELNEKSRYVAMKKQDREDDEQEMKAELTKERLTNKDLEIKIANLEGQLSQKPKVQTKIVQAEPSPIPSFEFRPIRGSDGRIQSVTATPKEH
jgi:hypothetical protein